MTSWYKTVCLSVILCCVSIGMSAQYSPDMLGEGFERRVIQMPDDYSGKIVTTFVRFAPSDSVKRAVLYVHGYNDYFFQSQMAQVFKDSLFNFYAVDLRKYGRSILEGQTPFEVHAVDEYFADIDTALQIIKAEGNGEIVLMGHSTGGLITSLYCQHRRENLPVQGLILNSPFLDMNLSSFQESVLVPAVSAIALLFKDIPISQSKSTAYAESLLKDRHGEWEYDTSKKFVQSPNVTSGWIRAIHRAQTEVQDGLQIPCPVLVMFSDKSENGSEWTPNHQQTDAVLDVADIEKYGKGLGTNVTEVQVKDGLHDLILSRKDVRDFVYQTIFSWMQENKLY